MLQKDDQDKINIILKKHPPQLFLFLSVDLIGSTAEKFISISKGKVLGWLKGLKIFYEILKEHGFSDKDLSIWKYLGDEILFYKELENLDILHKTVSTWKKFLELLQRPVKSYLWIAEFPVNNFIIRDNSNNIIDFIGPQIDLGFRLGQFSNSRKMVVSVELAYLLASTPYKKREKKFNWYFDGLKKIKGYTKESFTSFRVEHGYPVFWIDREKEESKFEKVLGQLHPTPRLEKQKVKELSDMYIGESNFFLHPFIIGDRIFGKVPSGYWAKYNKAVKEIKVSYDEEGNKIKKKSKESIDNIKEKENMKKNVEEPL